MKRYGRQHTHKHTHTIPDTHTHPHTHKHTPLNQLQQTTQNPFFHNISTLYTPPPTHTPPTPSTRTPTRLLAPDVIVVLPQIGAGQGAEGVHEGVRASYFYHVVVVVRNVLAQEGLRPRAEGAAVELRSEKEASVSLCLYLFYLCIYLPLFLFL